ncbi:TetR/AcrR family transcriptional regulator [Dactylosporangium aurantiacum]|uniref:TetR/AcrR family transcriptional regulator n=1 Tax=Dactylosporangium aurantiacum TaxID=35754 RepID=A0A9Q9IJY7_9ACTN|nr:TetR/AcrR family transcriptional regulator [Dactylosporangium aurantiacum]MDG6105705.1 TetR/AcrR family transcriptional regulator [Dactylosporangium aurantiacum]UWZ56971.1 TetR/AcrR family transcriptional regulator [Dactylosporangium aurantiacum]
MPKVDDAHFAARRRQILDAAAACFARQGFHRTSVQDIVRESGVSAGLVYRYFTGKDDMIAAIVTERHEQRERRFQQDPFGTYRELLRGLGDPAARDALRLSLQVWAETVRSAPIRDLVRSGVDRPVAQAADLLADAPLPPGVDLDSLVRVFIAVYQGLLLQTVLDDTLDHDRLAATAEHLLRAVLDPPPT